MSDTNSNSPRRERYLTWRRRLARLTIGALAAVILFRTLLAILLPITLNKAAGFYGMQCDYDRLKLSLLGGSAGVWGLRVTPQDGGECIARVAHAGGDISVWDLLRLKLSIWRLEADGIDMSLERKADGSIPLLQRLAQTTQKSQEVRLEKQSRGELNFSSPLSVEAISLSRVRLHLKDERVKPAFDRTVELSFNLDNLGASDRAASFALSVRSGDAADAMIDELRLAGTLRGEGRRLSVHGKVKGWGLRAAPAAGYLSAMGLGPVAESLEIDGALNLVTQPVDVAEDAVQAHLQLSGMLLQVNHETSLQLRSLTLDAPFLCARRMDLGRLRIDGAQANLGRTSTGLLSAAGFNLLPLVATTQPVPASTLPVKQPAVAAAATQPVIRASLDELVIKDVTARFRDDTANTTLEVRLDELRGTNWSSYPRSPRPAELSMTMALPGIASRLTLAVNADPFAGTKTGNVRFEMSGLKLDAARPYLAAAGLVSEFSAGTLRAELDGSFKQLENGWLKGDMRLKDLSLSDREQLLRWDNAAIRGLAVDPRSFEVQADAIELVGPIVHASRDPDGHFHVFGMRTSSATPSSAPPATLPAAAPQAELTLPIPRLAIGKFSWTGVQLLLDDSSVKPPATLQISDAGIIVEKIELLQHGTPSEPATFSAWLSAPGIVNKLEAKGTLDASLKKAKLNLNVRGQGLTLARISPYMEPAGLRSVLKDGAFKATLNAAVETTATGASGSLALSDVSMTDGTQELGALELTASLVHAGSTGIHLGEVMVKPRLHVIREANGDFGALGIRLGAAPGTAKPPAASQPAATATAAAANAPSPILQLDRLLVQDAKLRWTDLAVRPAVDWQTTTRVDLQGLCLGQTAPAAKLRITSSIAGVLQQLLVDGTLLTTPSRQGADLAVNFSGITGTPLNSYLPDALRSTFASGSLALKLSASRDVDASGQRLSAEARDLALKDGAESLASLAAIGVRDVSVNATGSEIVIPSVFLKKARLTVQRTPSGEIAFAGVRTDSTAIPPVAQAAREAATRATASPHADADILAMVTAARQALPLVRIKSLDLGVEELRYHDAGRSSARDIVIQNLSLANTGREIRLLGKDAMSEPPADLQLTFSVDDLISRGTAAMSIAPFATTPILKATLDLTGIHGDALAEFVPEVKGLVDGSTLKSGALHAELDLSAKIERRGVAAFDMRRDFSLYPTIRNVTFGEAGQPPVLGVESIQLSEVQVRPSSAEMIIPSLEITRPLAHIYKDADGIRVAGLRIIPPAASTSPSTRPAITPPAPVAPAAAVATVPPAGEILIRKLIISGIDASYEDRSVEPNVILPLSGLEIEVHDLSSRAAFEKRPVRFSGLVYGGKQTLPLRKGSPTTRPIFAQVSLGGQLSLYPQPQGWIKTSLSGFEVVAIGPIAHTYGVDIGGGLTDADVDVRIRSREDADVKARILLNDLALSEQENGPLFRLLHLPAPTNTVIGLLEDADGSITMRLGIPIRKGEFSRSAVAASAVSAVGRVVATAIASSPAKLVSGLTGAKKKVAKETKLELRFAPGDGRLRAADQQRLLQAVEGYRFDRQAEITLSHQLGREDIAAAGERVNPALEDAGALVSQLRNRRDELLQQQVEAEARARAELATYSALTSQRSVAQVQAISREIAQTEDALDRVLDLMRPGAQGQSDRRTRAAAIELGERRLAAVEEVLAGVPSGVFASRITKVPARFAAPDNDADGQVTLTIVSRNR